MRLRSASRELMREINQALILGIIRDRGPIPRTDIARDAHLSLATVSGITGDLIERGLIYEHEVGASTGGRPPILLALNPRAGYVVGVKLTETQIVAALTDLGAEIVERRTMPLTADHQPEAVAAALVEVVAELRRAHPDGRFLGLGLGMAGAIDRRAGICRFSPFFGWRDVPLRDLLESRLELPVAIENDVNTLTLAEQWFGAGVGVSDFLVVTLGRGVGMGMVLDGRLYRGGRGAGGEFGHLTIEPNGPRCPCGKRGCLEALVADPALVAAVSASIGQSVDLSEAAALARDGDVAASAVFTRGGEHLGLALAHLVNVFNPTLLIVGGEGVQVLDLLLPSLESALAAHCFDGLFADLKLVVEPWGDDAWARGAAGLMLDEFFRPDLERRPAANRGRERSSLRAIGGAA